MSEKVESVKKIRRRRAISMFLYELGRCLRMLIPKRKGGNKNSKSTLKKRQTIFVWSILVIPLLNFLVFWVYVNLDAILMSFQNIDYANGGREYWTLDNFKEIYRMFTQPSENTDNLLHYGANTLKFWLLSVGWSVPHSILLTYAFHKKLRGAKIFRVMLYLPSIICAVALAGIFEAFIGGNGALGYVLTKFFDVQRIPSWFQEEEWAMAGLLFYNFFFSFAGSYVVYSGAMANVDKEITEAAYMDGVSMWQEIWYIDIPLMWPTLSITVIGAFGGIFGACGPILLFTGGL